TLAAQGNDNTDVAELTARVRIALGRAITHQWFPGQGELHVIGLDSALEQVLTQAMEGSGALEPGLADTLMDQVEAALGRQEAAGEPPVLVVSPPLRPLMAQFLRRRLRQLMVMSPHEIPDDRALRVTQLAGGA